MIKTALYPPAFKTRSEWSECKTLDMVRTGKSQHLSHFYTDRSSHWKYHHWHREFLFVPTSRAPLLELCLPIEFWHTNCKAARGTPEYSGANRRSRTPSVSTYQPRAEKNTEAADSLRSIHLLWSRPIPRVISNTPLALSRKSKSWVRIISLPQFGVFGKSTFLGHGSELNIMVKTHRNCSCLFVSTIHNHKMLALLAWPSTV